MSLRNVLNRARFRDGNLHAMELAVVHRGAPGDRRFAPGSRITEIGAAGVTLELDGEEATFIPYHRVLAVHEVGGELLWDRERGAVPVGAPALRERPGEPAAEARADAVDRAEPEGAEVLVRHGVSRGATGGMLTLDGSAGEGGGQILRSALALSMLTGTPFAVENVRAGRKKPGLLRQHLTCLRAAAAISGAEVEGASLGSSRFVFRPGAVRGGAHTFDIGSAGSACLVLQMLTLPLARCPEPSEVIVRGGTHVPWSPIHPFLDSAFLPLVRRMGAEVEIASRAMGFHPAGGGELVMTTLPSGPLLPLHLSSPTGPVSVALTAVAADLPESIARRALTAAAERLEDAAPRLSSRSARSLSPGMAIWLEARDPASGAVHVFSALGERGVRAEDVGRDVALRFLEWKRLGVSAEAFITDQLLLPIALAGEGSFTCGPLSLHATTNIEVIEAFTGRRFRVRDLGEGRHRVSLGAGGGS